MKRITVALFIVIKFLVIVDVAIATALENKHDSLKLTLKETVFLALRNNAKIKSAEIGRVSQKYAVVVAKHAFQPNYSLRGSYQYYSSTVNKDRYSNDAFDVQPKVHLLTPWGTELDLSMNNLVTNSSGYTPSLTLEITQPLIRGFGRDVVEASLKNALDNEKINKLQYKDIVASVIDTVILDYINLARAIETLKISQVSLASYQTIIKKARVLIDAGRMARNDIIQIEAQIALQNSLIEHHKNELMRAQIKLLNTLGLDNQTRIQVPENIDYDEMAQVFLEKNSLPSADYCKKFVLTNNSSYQIAGIMLQVLYRSLLMAKDGTNWKLDLVVSANRHGRTDKEYSNINNLIRNKEHNEKVAVNLNIPIDDVNAKKALVDAQVGLDQAKLGYQQLKRQLEFDIITVYNSVINAKRQLELSKKALALQAQTVTSAELKYNAGRISNFELLSNQRDLTRLNQSVIDNQVNYINALITFNKILGETLTRFDIKIAY